MQCNKKKFLDSIDEYDLPHEICLENAFFFLAQTRKATYFAFIVNNFGIYIWATKVRPTLKLIVQWLIKSFSEKFFFHNFLMTLNKIWSWKNTTKIEISQMGNKMKWNIRFWNWEMRWDESVKYWPRLNAVDMGSYFEITFCIWSGRLASFRNEPNWFSFNGWLLGHQHDHMQLNLTPMERILFSYCFANIYGRSMFCATCSLQIGSFK